MKPGISANRRLFLLSLVLMAAITLIYWQVHSFGLITRDDVVTITYPETYPNLLSRPLTVFTTPMPESAFFWIPVTGFSLITDALIRPTGFFGLMHLTNVFYHALNAVILFLLLAYTTRRTRPAFLVALIFAVHPLNVETVTVVSNRATLLSMFFWMLSMVAYVYYTEKPSWKRYGLIILFFSLGLMAKPAIAGYVFLLPFLDIWPLRRYGGSASHDASPPAQSVRRLMLEKMPVFSFAAGWVIMSIYFFSRRPFYDSPLFSVAREAVLSRIINLPVSYFGYVYKFFLPLKMNYFTPAPPLHDFPLSLSLAAGLAVTAVTVILIVVLRRHKPLTVGWLWFLIGISPAAMANALMQNFITGRYAYFPLIGLAITAVWGLDIIVEKLSPKKQRIIHCTLIVLALLLLGLARQQTENWRSLISLYRHAISIDPGKSILHLNLGKALYQNGEADQAVAQFQIARRLCPQCPEPLINLGLAYRLMDNPQLALRFFEKAGTIQPDNMIINQNLAALYLQQKRFAEATGLLKRLLAIRPDYSISITYFLAVIYARQNDLENTVYWLKKSVEKNPGVWAMAEQEPVFEALRKTDQWRALAP